MGDRPHQTGGPTKRDIVWEQKRQQFMARQRNQQQPGPPPQQFQPQQQQQPPPQPQHQASNPAVWSGQSQVSEGFNPAGPGPRRSSASSLGSARSGLSSAGSNSLPVAPAPPFPQQQQQPNTGAIQGFPERPQQYEPNPAIRPPETADQAHYPSHQPFNQAAQQQQAYSNAPMPQQPPAPLPPQIQPQHMQQHRQHQQQQQLQNGTPQSQPAPFAVDSLDAFTKNNPTAGAIGAAAHQQPQRGQQYPPQSSGGRSTRSQTSSVPWGTDSDVDSARMNNRRKNMGSERPF